MALWATLALLLLVSLESQGQGNGYNASLYALFTATGSGVTMTQKSLMLYHEIIWTPSSASACTVTVDSSTDGVTWTTGGIVSSQVCTSSGHSSIVNAQANYLRVTVATLTGTSVAIQYEGWAYNPSPSSGGGAVSSVVNSDGTLTISPTTGAVVASLALGNANTWTATQSGPFAATTLSASGQFTSTVTTGTAPLVVASTTVVTNLTAGSLAGAGRTWAAPGTIGGTTPGIGDFSTLNCGVSSTTTCALSGFGSTSGSAMITWPAVAGTITNPFVFSNYLQASTATQTPLDNSNKLSSTAYVDAAVVAGGKCGASVNIINSSSSISATTICTPTVSGLYKINGYLAQSAGCAVLGIGSVTVSYTWTDEIQSNTAVLDPLSFVSSITGGNTNVENGLPLTYDVWAIAGQPIQYSTAYQGCSTGTATYNLHLNVTPN